jgi:predicted ester cyclase
MRSSRALVPAVLLLALALPGRAQEAPPAPADPLAGNKAVVRRYIEEVLSGGDLKVLDQLVAPDYVDSSPSAEAGHGPEAIRAAQARVRALFRDIHYRIDQLIAEGDKVVARYTVQAIRQEDKEVDAGDAGREIGISGMTIFRMAGGRIAETWTINDQLTMFRQLGYVLTPPKEQKPAAQPPGR